MFKSDLELIENKDRKKGENKQYLRLTVERDGEQVKLLFTEKELQKPLKRAKKNPEDFKKGFLSWLFK